MYIPKDILIILGILVQKQLKSPEGLSIEEIDCLKHFVKKHTCPHCGKIGWHFKHTRCGWDSEYPWDERSDD